MIQKTTFAALGAVLLTVLTPASQAQSANAPTVAAAAAQTPDQLINRLSNELLDAVRADKSIQAGDTKKVLAIVDERVVPYVSFQRMTSSAVGRYWRQATPEQQASLETEFKTLLMRTYAGALSQVKDQTVVIKPSRNLPEDEEQIVRTEVRGGGGDPLLWWLPQRRAGPKR
jgi:phospholipid transport system substrate-binding protein